MPLTKCRKHDLLCRLRRNGREVVSSARLQALLGWSACTHLVRSGALEYDRAGGWKPASVERALR